MVNLLFGSWGGNRDGLLNRRSRSKKLSVGLGPLRWDPNSEPHGTEGSETPSGEVCS
jgi:hypothetical protein